MHRRLAPPRTITEAFVMLDLAYLALGIAAFALMLLYAHWAAKA